MPHARPHTQAYYCTLFNPLPQTDNAISSFLTEEGGPYPKVLLFAPSSPPMRAAIFCGLLLVSSALPTEQVMSTMFTDFMAKVRAPCARPDVLPLLGGIYAASV